MSKMDEPKCIGDCAWRNDKDYHGEYADRIEKFTTNIDTDALLKFASTLRDGRACTISDNFSVGNFNLVRKIRFDDDIDWIARLRMPPIDEHDGDGVTSGLNAKQVRREMESELATMEFIRQEKKVLSILSQS